MPTSGRTASIAALSALATLAAIAGCVSRLEFPAPVKLLGPFTDLTANLGGIIGTDSTCGDVLTLAVRPDQDELIAGIPAHGLYKLVAGSSTWQQLGQGTGSQLIDNDPYSIVFDPVNPGVWWEAGIHNYRGVFFTQDDGDTFWISLYANGMAKPQNNDLVAIDFTDPARQLWVAGQHEVGTHVQVSTNAGVDWTDIGNLLPPTAGNTSWPLILDTNNWLLGSNNGADSGVYRTADGGATWSQVTATGVFSRPLLAHDGTIYWMSNATNGVIKSTDQGKRWSDPMGVGVTSLLVSGLVELPSGRLLAMGETYLLISDDQAETWTPIAQPPAGPFGMAYSAARKEIILWYNNDCLAAGPHPGAVLSLAFDDATQ